MEEQLTKERLDAFTKEEDALEILLKNRGKEILEMASDYGVNLRVCGCDKIQYFDDCFYIVEEWSCRGENGADYSEEIPLDALFSDEVLKKFLDDQRQEKLDREEKRKLEEYERDLEEYERLKNKLGK